MIYLDNAATTLRKPDGVVRAVAEALTSLGNASRGAHDGALNANRLLYRARRTLAAFFGCPKPEQVIFTNLLHKHPYTQMLQALECMVNALARGMAPRKKESTVGTEIVFQSSLPLYRQGESGRLIL